MTEGHIRRRGKSSWELKFDLGRDPLIDKRITKYKSVRGTKKAAQRELRQLPNLTRRTNRNIDGR